MLITHLINQSSIRHHVRTMMTWNIIESSLYSIAMLIHLSLLFNIMEISLYGLTGTIFSFIFLSEYVLCFGLNDIMGNFLSYWTTSRRHFNHFFFFNLVINYVLMIPYFVFFSGYALRTFSSVPYALHIIIIAIIFLEATKRICKTMLHILFLSKMKATIELCTFGLYLVIVWFGFLVGIPFTPITCFIPLLISSAISCLVLCVVIYEYVYKPIPLIVSNDKNHSFSFQFWIRIIKNRLYAIGYTNAKRAISGNFLVPIYAAAFGMEYAGILKFTKQIASYTTLIMRKIFGNISHALFAHARHAAEITDYSRQWIWLLTATTGTLIFLATLSTLILHWLVPSMRNNMILCLIISCFIHSITKHGISALERWFITYEKFVPLILVQLLPFSTWICVLWYSAYFTPATLIIMAAAKNVILFILLTCVIMYHEFFLKDSIKNVAHI